MTQTNAGGSVLSEHPVELAVAAAVGAALAAVVTVILLSDGIRSLSDEPPIRVRNGSVDLRLQGGKWEQVPNQDKKNWQILGEPNRGKDDFEVVIWGVGTGECQTTVWTGNPVLFTLQNGTGPNPETDTIEVKSTGKKTKIKANRNLLNEGDSNRLVSLPGNGWFIREIKVGNTVRCTQNDKHTGLRVALLDPDE